MTSFPAVSGASEANHSRYIDRELSWLEFNDRVLQEAWNDRNPLLERVRFLSISASNLDEFYTVRVATLRAHLREGAVPQDEEDISLPQRLSAIQQKITEMKNNQQKCWNMLRAELGKAEIRVICPEDIGAEDNAWIEKTFLDTIFPVLTPLAVDPAHPFPFIPNKGFALVLQLHDAALNEDVNALVPLPSGVDRFVRLPGERARYILLEHVVLMCARTLFPSFIVKEHGVLRILRDTEMDLAEEAEDLVRTFENALKKRRRGHVIRLSVNRDMPDGLKTFLQQEMHISGDDVFELDGLLGLADVQQLVTDQRPDLLFPPYTPRFPERIRDFGGDCFAAIRHKDIIVHHPYESFDVVVQFLRQAAQDPAVVAIKQTLYRTSKKSPIVEALIEAAEAGKSVTAVIELKARFDEEANIRWARDMERAGVHVVYGFIKLKTHAKMSMVVRRENENLRTYVHFGTGNYHPVTARIYADLSFFTCDPLLADDASLMFNYMTGYGAPQTMHKLAFSPLSLRSTLVQLIDQEIECSKNGEPAAIWAKLNALVDHALIEKLYEASGSGVQIDLIVRSMCCLRPGVPGLSDNIRVKSIVGRFLEHARIVCFGNGAALPSSKALVFISSADWMPRNLDRRIETFVPIENATVHQQVLDQIMVANLKDDEQSWSLNPDGSYTRTPSREGFSAHRYFLTNPSLSGRGKSGVEGETPLHLSLGQSTQPSGST